jgi:hypothetical protein
MSNRCRPEVEPEQDFTAGMLQILQAAWPFRHGRGAFGRSLLSV